MNKLETTVNKLWNRDFLLLVFGQTISIFGNMILSFALPLYVLDISESATMYGLVIALPFISLIATTPIGGIIADRLRKQRIMFWLDAATTLIIVLYIAASGLFAMVVPIVIIKLVALNAVQGLYMPAVQASVPVLVPTEKLAPANAVVGMVNTFAGMAGMAIAGLLYAEFGLLPILVVSAICFAITAIMDLLIRIPYKKQASSGGLVQIVKNDLAVSAKFIINEKPILVKCAVLVIFLQFTLLPMVLVGVPVLITQNLGFGMDLVGISSSIMMAGGLVGGITAGILGTKLSVRSTSLLLTIMAIAIIPVGLVFLFATPAFTAYIIITAAIALAVCVLQMLTIQFIAFVQTIVPTELIGKVMSLLVMLPFVANALGSFIYGVLFEQLAAMPWVIVFATVVMSLFVAAYAHKHFGNARPVLTEVTS